MKSIILPKTDCVFPTKGEELTALNLLIEYLTPNSYLAPWLSSVKGEAESLMRLDYPVTISLRQTFQECEDLKSATRIEVVKMLVEARKDAERLKEDALKSIDYERERLRDEFRKSLITLGLSL